MTRLAKVTEEQLSAYFDGELDPSERAQVEQWLARDGAGRAALAELGVMRGAITVSLDAERLHHLQFILPLESTEFFLLLSMRLAERQSRFFYSTLTNSNRFTQKNRTQM